MIFQMNDNEFTITSEDLMEAEYLKSFFTDPVHLKMETDFVRQGFHVTGERRTCVKLIKGDVP